MDGFADSAPTCAARPAGQAFFDAYGRRQPAPPPAVPYVARTRAPLVRVGAPVATPFVAPTRRLAVPWMPPSLRDLVLSNYPARGVAPAGQAFGEQPFSPWLILFDVAATAASVGVGVGLAFRAERR